MILRGIKSNSEPQFRPLLPSQECKLADRDPTAQLNHWATHKLPEVSDMNCVILQRE